MSAAIGDMAGSEQAPYVSLPAALWTLLPVSLPKAPLATSTPLALHLSLEAPTGATVLVSVPDVPCPLSVVPALAYLGGMLQRAGLHDFALATWEQYGEAVRATPAVARALLCQGDALQGLRRTKEATERYRAALAAVDPAKAKPGIGEASNYNMNRLASDMSSIIRSRLASLVPRDILTPVDVAALEALAAIWPPSPESKQASLQVAEYQVSTARTSSQTVSYLLDVFDASGEHTTACTTRLRDNQPLVDRISRPTPSSLLAGALELLNTVSSDFGPYSPVEQHAIPSIADAWQKAEATALARNAESACSRFEALERKHRGTVVAALAKLAAGQWARGCGIYDISAGGAQHETVMADGGPLGDRRHLGVAETHLSCGECGPALRAFKQVATTTADARLRDWATYRTAQCQEFAGQWNEAQRSYARLTQCRHTELREEARMAGIRLAALARTHTPAQQQVVRYLGEDRATQGDWYTYYGSEGFVLCAQQAPQDVAGGRLPGWEVTPSCGRPGEKTRYWVTGPSDGHRSVLYNPLARVRRAANWDDRGEAHPRATGPDLWLEIPVPAGQHRLSLYFVNDHNYYEPRRTYTVSVFDQNGSYQTGTDVRDFVNGVYKQFLAAGPTTLRFLISRDLSMNVLISGVFLDPAERSTPQLAGLPPHGPETRAWQSWQCQRDRHLSPRSEQLAFAQYLKSLQARTTPEARDAFLGDLAKSELKSGLFGPALWAALEQFALPYSGREQRLKRMVDATRSFLLRTPIRAPHSTQAAVALPVARELFQAYLTAGVEGLPTAQCEAFYRQAMRVFLRDDPALASDALERLAGLLGQSKLTPEDRRYAAILSRDDRAAIGHLTGALAAASPGEERLRAQVQLLGRYLTANRLDQATGVLEAMQKENPKAEEVANALYSLGLAYLRQRNDAAARDYLSQVVGSFPQTQWARYAETYLQRMRTDAQAGGQ
ncbi:hypothetical protein LLH03_03325 [bacterium]|nr:hypothetical protein [bacterium]